MAVDFLDIAPLEAGEWTISVPDQDGRDQEVTVFPFDLSDIAALARSHCAKAVSIFTDISSPQGALDFAEAKPYVTALAFVGRVRLRDKKLFDAAVAKVRALPQPEQRRIFNAVWEKIFGKAEESEDDKAGAAPPTAPPPDGEDPAGEDAASPRPSPS